MIWHSFKTESSENKISYWIRIYVIWNSISAQCSGTIIPSLHISDHCCWHNKGVVSFREQWKGKESVTLHICIPRVVFLFALIFMTCQVCVCSFASFYAENTFIFVLYAIFSSSRQSWIHTYIDHVMEFYYCAIKIIWGFKYLI